MNMWASIMRLMTLGLLVPLLSAIPYAAQAARPELELTAGVSDQGDESMGWNRVQGPHVAIKHVTVDDGFTSTIEAAVGERELERTQSITRTHWTTHTRADGLANNSVTAIAVDGDDHLWFGTWGGVSAFDRTNWTTYTTADGSAHNWVFAVAVDDEGHLWFGTWGGGVSEFDGITWTTYTTSDGLANNRVGAIAVDGEGHVWFGTWGGVSEFDGSTWNTARPTACPMTMSTPSPSTTMGTSGLAPATG